MQTSAASRGRGRPSKRHADGQSTRGMIVRRGTFGDWEQRLAALLQEAIAEGALRPELNPSQSAAFFWTGWEGAVLRARLLRSVEPLDLFLTTYLATLPAISTENGDRE